MALLEARGLVKQYGRRTVVRGVDIDVDQGEIVGLLGPNGAGKTTSFRMMVGMIAPKAGVVTFNGLDVTHKPMYQRARLGLGYLAQDSSIFRRLTVEQNLFAILELMTTRRGQPFRSNAKQRRERVDELLDQFGLTRLRKSVASTLSGGERRRLEIARCLVSEPMLIMLDEPFTGIDPKTVSDIQTIIRELRTNGIGVLITDHHVAETLRITDRSYLIADGKMLTHGTPMEIVNDREARAVYLGENFNAAAIEEGKPLSAPMASTPPEDDDPRAHVLQLAGPKNEAAVAWLRQRPEQAIAALLEGLGEPDPNVRTQAYGLLGELLQMPIEFEPNADETTRDRQILELQQLLARRRAS